MHNKKCKNFCMNKSDPNVLGVKCGFKDGVFTEDNYACTLLIALRDEKQEVYNNDSRAYILVIPWDIDPDLTGEHDFIVLEHYKHRGCTKVALMIGDEGSHTLTHDLAIAMVEHKLGLKFDEMEAKQ